MAMTKQNNRKNDCIILNTIEQLVPQDHLVRKLEATIDWNFIYPLVEDLYSEYGRPSIDPVVLFKMIFINIVFGVNSMRKTCEEIKVNLAYRWLLGLSMDDSVPNYSTWSQNYIRRYGDSNVFDEIFDTILKQAISYKYIDLENVFADSTHQKACANKKKSKNKEVEIAKKIYEDELLNEINKVRIEHGQKPIETINRTELTYDEETGEIKEEIKTKNISESTTDPECGCYHKGEKEKMFAYSHTAFCDKNGFVLNCVTVPGNVHDSVSFFDAYEDLNNRFDNMIKGICLDAGYITPAICKEIFDNNQTPIVPYKRPMTKKGFFKKYEYIYDEYYDCYICPNNKIINYTRTGKEGYKEYKSNSNDCEVCPFRDKCTNSKDMVKVITRHVWEEYKEEANHIRYTDNWEQVYPLRKQTIERVFADCKEHHNLRFTRLKGLKKNRHNVSMIFTSHNLKKMANWRWKTISNSPFFTLKYLIIRIKLIEVLKKVVYQLKYTTLSTI